MAGRRHGGMEALLESRKPGVAMGLRSCCDAQAPGLARSKLAAPWAGLFRAFGADEGTGCLAPASFTPDVAPAKSKPCQGCQCRSASHFLEPPCPASALKARSF